MRLAILAAAGTIITGTTALPLHASSTTAAPAVPPNSPCVMPHSALKAFTSWLNGDAKVKAKLPTTGPLADKDELDAVLAALRFTGKDRFVEVTPDVEDLHSLTSAKTAKIVYEAKSLPVFEVHGRKKSRGLAHDVVEGAYERDGPEKPAPLDLLRHKYGDETGRNEMVRVLSTDEEAGGLHEEGKRSPTNLILLDGPNDEDEEEQRESGDLEKRTLGDLKQISSKDLPNGGRIELTDSYYERMGQRYFGPPGYELPPVGVPESAEQRKARMEEDAAAVRKWKSMTPEEVAAIH
ncbi:hypothetical protein ACHAQA_007798 [Verticillium albo-atrum]